MNIIITGPKHCGKSTVISRVIGNFPGSTSGFITEFENRESDSRELKLHGLSGYPCYCAVKWTDGVFKVHQEVFDRFAPALIDCKSELIVIDELGKFERDCRKLKESVVTAFSSSVNVLASVRLDAAGWVQELKSRPDTEVIIVNEANRDFLPDQILRLLTDDGKLI